MDIKDFNESQYVDIFGTQTVDNPEGPKFGMNEDNNVDILDKPDPVDPVEPVEPVTPTEPTEPHNTDILGEGEDPKKPGRPAKTDIKDIQSYFQERVKSGKFVTIEEEDQEGKKTQFIPKTAEEVDEAIDIQINYRLDEATKGLEEKWYNSKSPAWKAVAQYAELTDNPADILPFLQGIKTIDSVAELDPKEIDHAERIVRTRLEQRGDSDDIIQEQIEALKTTDKLVSTAEKYKPLIVKEEQQNLSQMINAKKQEEQQWNRLVAEIRDNVVKTIEAPIFGKQKLKQDEKALVYDLIGQPNEQSNGYKIYSAIDALFETGKFDTLKKIALLIGKEDSLISYISNSAADKAAEGLQRKLRVSTEGKASGAADDYSEDAKIVQRTKYSQQPRFGR